MVYRYRVFLILRSSHYVQTYFSESYTFSENNSLQHQGSEMIWVICIDLTLLNKYCKVYLCMHITANVMILWKLTGKILELRNEKLCFKSMKANSKPCCLPSWVRSLSCLPFPITVSMILILCFKDLSLEKRRRDLKHDNDKITTYQFLFQTTLSLL